MGDKKAKIKRHEIFLNKEEIRNKVSSVITVVVRACSQGLSTSSKDPNTTVPKSPREKEMRISKKGDK